MNMDFFCYQRQNFYLKSLRRTLLLQQKNQQVHLGRVQSPFRGLGLLLRRTLLQVKFYSAFPAKLN